MIDLAAALPTILPMAIAWAEAQSRLVLTTGAPLTEYGISDAKTVGVATTELHPEEVSAGRRAQEELARLTT